MEKDCHYGNNMRDWMFEECTNQSIKNSEKQLLWGTWDVEAKDTLATNAINSKWQTCNIQEADNAPNLPNSTKNTKIIPIITKILTAKAKSVSETRKKEILTIRLLVSYSKVLITSKTKVGLEKR